MTRRLGMQAPGVRRTEICALVSKRGEISVETLADKFGTSPETIRRDLNHLDNAGRVRKIHGGARPISHHAESAFDERMRHNGLEKRLIAEKLVAQIAPGQSVFMDTGSTTLICAEVLARKKLTVFTNSSRIATVFSQGKGGSEVYLLGGLFRGDNAQTVGPTSIDQIRCYRADVAIITIGAIDDGGVTDFSNHESQIARAMISASDKLTIVVDRSKFNRAASFKVCELNEIDTLISDKSPSADLLQSLNNADVAVF